MKTFMKFTLAVFVMLLAGAAGQERILAIGQTGRAGMYRPSMSKYLSQTTTENRFIQQGCARVIRGSENVGDLMRAIHKDPSDARNHFKLGYWQFDNLFDSGCAWCLHKRAKGETCQDFKNEFDMFVRFKMGQYNGEHGRIVLGDEEKKVPENLFCTYSKAEKLVHLPACAANPAPRHCYTKAGRKCKYGLEAYGSDQYGPGNPGTLRVTGLQIAGWSVPELWRGRILKNKDGEGKTRFTTLEKATECFNRGCSERGYQTARQVANRESLDKTGKTLDEVEAMQEMWVRPPSKAQTKFQSYNSVRKTIDAKAAPVNQSKGFDGYQTALIVGLSVASSFITAGSIYACRRLNEKAIELPGDVEGQNVAL